MFYLKEKLLKFFYSGFIVLLIGLLGGRISGNYSTSVLNIIYIVIVILTIIIYFGYLKLKRISIDNRVAVNKTLLQIFIPIAILLLFNNFYH